MLAMAAGEDAGGKYLWFIGGQQGLAPFPFKGAELTEALPLRFVLALSNEPFQPIYLLGSFWRHRIVLSRNGP
jgi:hypothetical protein